MMPVELSTMPPEQRKKYERIYRIFLNGSLAAKVPEDEAVMNAREFVRIKIEEDERNASVENVFRPER